VTSVDPCTAIGRRSLGDVRFAPKGQIADGLVGPVCANRRHRAVHSITSSARASSVGHPG
jgi:hypothetical protein